MVEDHYAYVKSKVKEIVDVAASMIDGTVDLIEGCRRITALRYDAEISDDEIFDSIVAVESETDHFPLGTQREYCNNEYLTRVDEEKQNYLMATSRDIINICRQIIDKYSSP